MLGAPARQLVNERTRWATTGAASKAGPAIRERVSTRPGKVLEPRQGVADGRGRNGTGTAGATAITPPPLPGGAEERAGTTGAGGTRGSGRTGSRHKRGKVRP